MDVGIGLETRKIGRRKIALTQRKEGPLSVYVNPI